VRLVWRETVFKGDKKTEQRNSLSQHQERRDIRLERLRFFFRLILTEGVCLSNDLERNWINHMDA